MAYDVAVHPSHWRRAVAESILGSILARRGQPETANALLQAAWTRLRETKGETATQTREAQARWQRWQHPEL